jgi:hypothetical protein
MQRKLGPPGARRAFKAALAVAGAVVATGAVARAETPHPPIVLVLDPCAAVDAQEVRRLVPIEMGAPLAAAASDGVDTARVDTTRVFVGCVVGSPQLVRLEVRDPVGGKRVDRVITLVGDSKTDQARLVAIVAVELVAASRGENRSVSEGAAVAPPAPDPRTLVVMATPAAEREVARPRWRALALGSLRHVSGLPRVLPGGGLALERAWPRGWALGADVLAEGATLPTALGDVDALLVSIGLVGSWRLERGRLAVQSGLGARGGVARLVGRAPKDPLSSVRPGSLSAPWVGPLAAARATVTLGRSLVISLGGELGYVTSAIAGHVQGQPDVAVSGAWWNVVAGVGFGL